MKIYIKEKRVTIYDETGSAVNMTTEQLLEMIRTINAATNEDGVFIFTLLEFNF